MNSLNYSGNLYINHDDHIDDDDKYIIILTTTHGRRSGIPISEFNIIGGLFDNGKSIKTDRFVDFQTMVKNDVECKFTINADGHSLDIEIKMDSSSDYFTGGSANIEAVNKLGLKSISSELPGDIITYKLDNDSPI